MTTHIHLLAPNLIHFGPKQATDRNPMNSGKNILDTLQREYLELARDRSDKKLDPSAFEAEVSKIKMTAYDLLSHTGISREEAFDQVVIVEQKCKYLLEEKDENLNPRAPSAFRSTRSWRTGQSAIYPL